MILRVEALVRSPAFWLGVLVVVATLGRLLWLDAPASPFFDEIHYVGAARAILGWPQQTALWTGVTPGIDPNVEHPPLGKLVIAASMAAAGDNPIGWRLPSVLAGAFSLVAVYGIVRRLGGSGWTALVAASALALESLTLVLARLAMLDGMLVALLLASAWLALDRRWVPAGLALALGTLVKLSAVFGLVAIIGWVAWDASRRDGRAGLRSSMQSVGLFSTAFVASAVAGLWVLDLLVTPFSNPADHLARIVGGGIAYASDMVSVFGSQPWGWLAGSGGVTILDHVTPAAILGAPVAGSVVPVLVRAVINPVLAATTLTVLALAALRVRATDGDLERWSLLWVGAMYLPWVAVELAGGRVMFIHYMLPVVPGIAIATAAALRRFPAWATWAYLSASAVGLLMLYPIRWLA